MLRYNIMNTTIKSLLFIVKVLYISISESFWYLIFNNYSLYINNLTSRLASINILYVKIFQAFALNNHFIDDEISNKLLQFTDNAPWSFDDINLHELSEIADNYGIVLKSGYEIPINSGMISLVFKGYKKEDLNVPIIIKMKRNNIDNILKEAIEQLLFLAYIVSFIPLINKFQLTDIIYKNIDIISHQTNFLEEIDNMEKIRENCKYLKYIEIPKANREVTEKYPNTIIMEYINGIKINQIKEEDRETFAKLIIKFGLVTTIIHGVTHGDLHSGNILFIKNLVDTKSVYKLGIIDFGIIYNVETKYKGFLFDILTQMFETSPRESAEKILNSGIIEPTDILNYISHEHYNNIVTFLEEIIYETINNSKMANQVQIYKFISKLKEYLNSKELSNIGIKPSDDFIKTQLVIAMAHGVTLTLCNNNFINLMDKVLNELFHTNMLI